MYYIYTVCTRKWYDSARQLPEDDSEAIYIDLLRVRLVERHLRSHVDQGARMARHFVSIGGLGSLAYAGHQTEIKYFQLAVFREANVLRFQI